MTRICLLSPVHPWVNPRLVKEADALHAAGFDVVVGYRSGARWQRDRDAAILEGKPWRWHRFDYGREDAPARWFLGASRQKLAERAVRLGFNVPRLDAETYCRGFSEMRSWAARQRADLYIAHSQPALAIAADAARITESRFAFDCEDLLAEEVADGGRASWLRDLIVRLEGRYLPRARYVSATSVPMRDYLRTRYGLARVPVWTNSFPLSDLRDVVPPAQRRRNSGVKLVWISATIGPGRGIEDILRALPRLPESVELHLYGKLHAQFEPWLREQMEGSGRDGQVIVHPLLESHAIMPTLAGFDVGLSLEQNDCLNKSLTISNKLCMYLQAGLATVATMTPGQASVLRGRYDAGVLYEPGDIDQLVAALATLMNRDRLDHMKAEAWRAGQETYNWDVEQAVFLQSVREALA